MDIKKEFGTNKQAEEEGVWVDAGEGLRLLIARLGGPTYTKYLQKIGLPYAKGLSARNPNIEVLNQLTQRAVAKRILLGWKNLQEEGKDIPYSSDKALELFDTYPDFYRMVVEYASDRELFVAEIEETVVGN